MNLFEIIKENNMEALQRHLTPQTLESLDEEGNTPLMIAAQEGLYGVVKFLLDAGANKHATNYAGKTAFDLAFDAKKTLVMKLFLA
jgi:ankyrin repeat protein